MTLAARVKACAVHPDPVTAGCNRIVLPVAGSQPTFPPYLWRSAAGVEPVYRMDPSPPARRQTIKPTVAARLVRAMPQHRSASVMTMGQSRKVA